VRDALLLLVQLGRGDEVDVEPAVAVVVEEGDPVPADSRMWSLLFPPQ